jgi:ribosome-binding factor A
MGNQKKLDRVINKKRNRRLTINGGKSVGVIKSMKPSDLTPVEAKPETSPEAKSEVVDVSSPEVASASALVDEDLEAIPSLSSKFANETLDGEKSVSAVDEKTIERNLEKIRKVYQINIEKLKRKYIKEKLLEENEKKKSNKDDRTDEEKHKGFELKDDRTDEEKHKGFELKDDRTDEEIAFDKKTETEVKTEASLDANPDKNSDVNPDEKSMADFENIAMVEAEKMWFQLKIILIKNGEEYKKLKDEERMELFNNSFSQFIKEFPIVSKYMICMGQYSQNAFEKYLKKSAKTTANTLQRRKDKEYMENMWIERQADYVKFLWIDTYGKKYKNPNYARKIWEDAYNTIKKEFVEFRKLHKDMEVKVKKDESNNKVVLLNEAIDRALHSNQKPTIEQAKNIKYFLQNQLIKQNKIKMLQELKFKIDDNLIKWIAPKCEGMGINYFMLQDYEEELRQFSIKKNIK